MAEKQEDLRVGLLRLTGNDDPVITQTLAHVQTFTQAIQTNPDNIIKQTMEAMHIAQIMNIHRVASMGNHKTTLALLSKSIYEADHTAINTKTNNLAYAKECCLASADLAFITQYHDGRMLDQQRFKDDIADVLLNIGRAQGVASAAPAAPAGAEG